MMGIPKKLILSFFSCLFVVVFFVEVISYLLKYHYILFKFISIPLVCHHTDKIYDQFYGFAAKLN